MSTVTTTVPLIDGTLLTQAFVSWLIVVPLMLGLWVFVWRWEGGTNFCKDSPDGSMFRPFAPEKIRIMGYSSFWIVVGLGVVLTRNFSGIDMNDNLLTRVFGYPNICINFDFPPSNVVLPLVWVLTLGVLLLYLASDVFLLHTYVQKGVISASWCRALTYARVFEGSTFIFFSVIFSVSPFEENLDPDYVRLRIHTAPFTILQFGTTSLFTSMLLRDHLIDKPARLGYPRFLWNFVAPALAIMTWVCVIFKTVFSWNAMLKEPWFQSKPLIATRIPEIADKFYLITAAVLPLLYAIVLVAFRYDKLDKVNLAATPFYGTDSFQSTKAGS